MPYIRRIRPGRRAMGDFNDETLCSSIPAGDPYRKPGNYCATGDGGYTTFNADGSTFVQPSSSSDTGGVASFIGKLGGALLSAMNPSPTPAAAPVVAPGMSTMTKVALAGAALVAVALIARRN